MDFRVLVFSLLIFVYIIDLASSDPTQKTLPSEFVQKNKLEDKAIYEIKIKGGSGRGGSTGGGRSHGSGSSGSPATRGGGAVIPIYAAGAANKNRQRPIHHSDATCNLNKITFSTMLMIALVYPLILSS